MDPDRSADVIIVGSGPAGAGAAMGFAERGVVPLMLDVGIEPAARPPQIDVDFYRYAEQHDTTDLVIGCEGEGLYNLNPLNPHVSFMLTVPKHAFVRHRAAELGPIEQENISVVQSFAKGGLANAWGCAAYRYTDRDLASYPIAAADLDPFYDAVTREIGVNGADDDLTPFYGSTQHLQPAVRLGANSAIIARNYQKQKARLNAQRVFVGRMRSAVLTEDLGPRRAYPYLSTDMFARLDCFYSPATTVDRLAAEKRLRYQPGVLVKRWRSVEGQIEVHATAVGGGEPITFCCRRLVLAAGAVNTSRIVLESFADYATELPLLDNPAVYVPSFLPGRFGKRIDSTGYGFATLACVYDMGGYATPLQGLVFETTTVPRAEFYRHMPFAGRMNLKLVKYALPAMVVFLLYFPSDALPPGRLRLRKDGTLSLRGPDAVLPKPLIRRIIKLNRRLGLYTHPVFAEPIVYGGSIHYAGCLPMRAQPAGRYETTADGELAGARGVFVADGAALPQLSSKNHTLTVMANAMRIAQRMGHG